MVVALISSSGTLEASCRPEPLSATDEDAAATDEGVVAAAGGVRAVSGASSDRDKVSNAGAVQRLPGIRAPEAGLRRGPEDSGSPGPERVRARDTPGPVTSRPEASGVRRRPDRLRCSDVPDRTVSARPPSQPGRDRDFRPERRPQAVAAIFFPSDQGRYESPSARPATGPMKRTSSWTRLTAGLAGVEGLAPAANLAPHPARSSPRNRERKARPAAERGRRHGASSASSTAPDRPRTVVGLPLPSSGGVLHGVLRRARPD